MGEPKYTHGLLRAGYADAIDRRLRMLLRAENTDGQPYIAICPADTVSAGAHEGNARLIAGAWNAVVALADRLGVNAVLLAERLANGGMDLVENTLREIVKIGLRPTGRIVHGASPTCSRLAADALLFLKDGLTPTEQRGSTS